MNNKLPVTPLLLSVTIVIDIHQTADLQIKKCVTEATHRKTQTPIVAKQNSSMTGFPIQQLDGICAFTKFT